MSKKTRQLLLCSVLFLIVLFFLILKTGNTDTKKTAKIGFIMSGYADDIGWNGNHYEGIKAACKNLGAELFVKEGVLEFQGACELAIEELAEEGVEMIILSSYGYPQEVHEFVKNYPEIVFYGNASEYQDKNLTYYFTRMYQARYLSGIIAGMMTETDKIGYVAAMPNNEVNRGISAFALGVKRVNPNAEVVVKWTGEWDNRKSETTSANALIKEVGVDVLAYHQNQTYVAEAAEQAGVYCIGYHIPLENASSRYLTAVEGNWDVLYEELIAEFLKGKGNLQANYWLGLEADCVGLSQYSEEIPEEIIAEVEKAKNEILSGKDVFSGIIYDNQGNKRCNTDEAISDDTLLEKFDWYAEGVRIYE